MHRIPVWVITFVLTFAAAAPAAGQAPAAGEREAGQWQFVISPYFMGAAMSGTTAVAGQEMQVDLSASDIFENLKFGMMGTALARKGKWGLGFDGMWASLGATTPADPAFTVDGDQGQFGFYGVRQLADVADLTVGLRWNIISNALGREGAPRPLASDTVQWLDPLVGLNLHLPAGRRLRASLYAEIGGFGLGSDLAWQLCPTIGVQASRRLGVDVGWRWLAADYESGSGPSAFKWDVIQQGPVLGLAFAF
jgi:hypothetical protein